MASGAGGDDVAVKRDKHAARAPLGRLVVAYDGSDGADAAAAFGLWLAGKAGSAVTVVHASPAPEAAPSAGLLPGAAEQVVADEREWRRRMRNLREYAGPHAVVETRVVRGQPAGAIIAAAIEHRADAVLMGSHGSGPMRGALLGSASSQVLAHAPCAVMLFREHAATEPASHVRSVVVGVDGSPSSARALEIAQALAAPLGATVVLVHAYDPHVPFAVMTTEGMRDLVRQHGREVLATVRETVDAPSPSVEDELVEGRAGDALVAACERHAPAILAVGSRGRGGFKELLLGSTSHEVANNAPCPVLVARRLP